MGILETASLTKIMGIKINSAEAAKDWLRQEINRMFPKKQDSKERQLVMQDLDKMTHMEILKMYREWKG